MRKALLGVLFITLLIGNGCYHYPPVKTAIPKHETVVCVHGLFETVLSMKSMAKAFAAQGYDVHVIRYFSTRYTVEEHINDFDNRLKKLKIETDMEPVHFVTHSLGGIIVRGYLAERPEDKRFGRIVMLAPPNQGSEWADRIFKVPFTPAIAWPLKELRTTGDESVKYLGSPGKWIEIGIIAGGKEDGQGFARTQAGDGDGVVSVAATHIEGEQDHIVLPYHHNVIAMKKEAIDQAVHFIMNGAFKSSENSEKDTQ